MHFTWLHVRVLNQSHVLCTGTQHILRCLAFKLFLGFTCVSFGHLLGKGFQDLAQILIGLGFPAVLLFANQKQDGPGAQSAKAFIAVGLVLHSTLGNNGPSTLELVFCCDDLLFGIGSLQLVQIGFGENPLDVVLVLVCPQHGAPHGHSKHGKDFTSDLEVGVAHCFQNILANLELDVEIPTLNGGRICK